MKKTTVNKNKSSVCRLFITGILTFGLMFSCSDSVEEESRGIPGANKELEDMYNYLISESGGKTPNDPVEVKMSIRLTELNYLEMLTIIEKVGKYVNLNLNECDFSDSTSSSVGGLNRSRQFNTMQSASTGKSRIVNLELPIVATGITGNFTYFDSMKTISGENVAAITVYDAFSGLTALTSASFPKAASIANSTFQNCSNMVEITFPATATISGNPFIGCSSLSFNVIGKGALSTKEDGKILLRNETELVSYPSASGKVSLDYLTALGSYSMSRLQVSEVEFVNVTKVESYAFYYSSSLTSINMPKAAALGNYSFYNNTNLKELIIPSAKEIGSYALAYTGNVPLVITLGTTQPSLGNNLLSGITKTVNVMIPDNAEGYDENWIEAFIGKGSEGTGTANENITVNIAKYKP